MEFDAAYYTITILLDELIVFNSSSNNVKKDKTNMNSIVEKLKTELRMKMKECNDYKETLKNNNIQYSDQIEHLKSLIKQKENELDNFVHQLENHRIELNNVTNECKQSEGKRVLLEKALEDANYRFGTIDNHNAELMRQNSDLKNQLNNNLIKLESVTEDLDKANSELDQLHKEVINANLNASELQKFNQNEHHYLQQALRRFSQIFELLSDIYLKEYIPLINQNSDFFSHNILKLMFPKITEIELKSYPEQILDWLNAFLEYFKVIKDELKDKIEENYSTNLKLRCTIKEIGEKNSELQQVKIEQNKIIMNNREMQERIYTIEKQLNEAITEYL